MSENSHPLQDVFDRMATQRDRAHNELLSELTALWSKGGTIQSRGLFIKIGYSAEETYQAALRAHPAIHLANKVSDLKRAFEILSASRLAMVDLVGKMHGRLTHMSFADIDFDANLNDATRELYTYSCAALSLVQAYRHVFSKSEERQALFKALFDEVAPDKRILDFVREIRVANSHKTILQARPAYNVTTDFKEGTKTVSSELLFDIQTIIESADFSGDSKEFAKERKTLAVLEVVNKHFEIAKTLHSQFETRTGLFEDAQLIDLHKMKMARQTCSHRMSIGMILQVAGRRNPYDYLSRWFTEEELKVAYALPHHSKEQLDFLISLKDPLRLCDEHTYYSLSKFFSITPLPKNPAEGIKNGVIPDKPASRT